MTIVVAITTTVVAANKQTDLKSAGIPYGMPATFLQGIFRQHEKLQKTVDKKSAKWYSILASS
ncbi:MAG TPA: hypothetical protein IAD32_01135 [Candidatus Scatavimonas merdigallinarum]|uniref:Uncharacterized protein n=1 Tax=Candidatus Scatavimonas merdigallinarum TaxID=2840914 RepID=A0A9D0ZFV4_9FIRM|nr:hypothetical protein [Candidatus Scatavimonas merdigallinarum]